MDGLCFDVDWGGGIEVLYKRGGKRKSYLQSKLSSKVLKCMLTVRGIGIVSVKYTYCGVPRITSLGTPRVF